jgi:hypothetical protein
MLDTQSLFQIVYMFLVDEAWWLLVIVNFWVPFVVDAKKIAKRNALDKWKYIH